VRLLSTGKKCFGAATLLLLWLMPGLAQPQNPGGTHSPHGSLNVACQNCHTLTGWKPIRGAPEFDHNQTRYPLRGMHENVACTQCHTKLVFTNVGHQCADCHADIHRRQFGANCEQCHTVKGWNVSVQQINEHQNRFPLLGAHAAVDCDQCHKSAAVGQFQGLSTQCISCHQREFQTTVMPNHVQFGFPTQCEACHSVDNWLGAKFDHAKFAGIACVACHLPDYQKTTNPNHAALNFSQTCQQCHTTVAWSPATFDHSTVGFPLTGAHATVSCTQCHLNNNYNLTTTACVSCHLKDFQGTTNPNHVQSGFPQTCEQCHNTTSWLNATFDHSTTGFPLTGAHTTVACILCHVNSNYNLTNTTCVSCHLTDFNGTNSPNHVQVGFAQTCQNCHNTTSWLTATFDHSTTGFPLTGAHTALTCAQCHVNNNYSLTSAACVTCHLADFNSTTSPNHVQGGFPQTCEQCHNTTSWLNANFNHANTGFPLTGAHTTLQCTQCHVNNNYSLTSAACVNCHLADFNGTTNPNHVTSGFPQTCQNCHSTTNWLGAVFDHATTGFPLTGAHATLMCTQCHVNNNYSLTSAACVTCHLANYQTTTSPPHAAAGFSQTCQNCHSTSTWLNATFNHATTGFALTGFHTTLTCAQCHTNNNYSLTSGACAQCHMANYTATTSPSHVAAGFPTTCDSCHTTTNWLGATFNHASTGFALIGAHANATCAMCHVNNNFSITTTACVSCHQTDYNNATTPVNHTQLGFPVTCELCHDTVLWTNATFNHNNTPFPLLGAHTSVACASCHVSNNYTTLPTDCYGCHKATYLATANPNHTAAGFPTTCVTCHITWITTNWLGATFNHTFFPLNHGNANGVCSVCHTNSNDYLVFQCTGCHGGNNAANFNHPNVGGYVYNSVNCYQCHRN
jgi:NMD protein affecting ribosome stability and mRNA decay